MVFGGFLCRSNYDQKKRYSRLAVGWNVWGFHQLGLFWRVPSSNYDWKKRYRSSVAMSDCFGEFVALCFGGFLDQITNYDRKKDTVVWLAYTICNTRNILFLLCLYFKGGNKLNIGIVWFEGKAPARTSKTCLTMVERPSSMAMGNQPMPLRYPLRKRLSELGQGARFFVNSMIWQRNIFF